MNRPPTAQVVNLADARQRPTGQRTVERLCDGRRKGNHGNRASAAMKAAVIRSLRETLALTGDVTAADKEHAAQAAGVDPRTVRRWWNDELTRELKTRTGDAGGNLAGRDGGMLPPVDLPRYLYRYAEPGKLQLTPAEAAFIGQHSTIRDGIDALRDNPDHRLANYGISTIYAAYANIAAPVRVSAKRGAAKGRAIEATYPLTGRDQVNQTWSIDEYDLKVVASYGGVIVHPKVLIVRERNSGTPLSLKVVPVAATGIDTGHVLAAAAIGYTTAHPRRPDQDLRVSGVARYFVSDQGGAFLGDDGTAAARRLGIGPLPVPSHQPQANGDHEVMHQSLLRHFADGPGSRRGWTDRAGQRLDHGVLPYETVLAQVDAWFATYLATEFTKGDRAGRTRLEVYADEVDAGNIHHGHDLTPADEAALASVVAEHAYDPTRGVMWNKRYWLGPELASAATPSERITLKQLLDPDTLYAFDRHDRFIGIVRPREAMDIDDIHDVHADRVAREQFVKERIAKPKAKHGQTDAEHAWDEVGEALAEAADAAITAALQQPDPTPEPDTEPDSQSEATLRDGDSVGEGEVHTAVKATQRRRKPTTPSAAQRRRGTPAGQRERTDVDDDADATALADLFHNARTHQPAQPGTHTDDDTTQDTPDADQ